MPRQLSHTPAARTTHHQLPSQTQSILSVHVTPSAKKNILIGFKESEWHIKIAAPPVDSKANEELILFLSVALDLRKSALCIIKGQTSRHKQVRVDDMCPAEIETRLSALATRR